MLNYYLVEFSNSDYPEEFTANSDEEAIAAAQEFEYSYNDWVGYAPAVTQLYPSAVYRMDEWGNYDIRIY